MEHKNFKYLHRHSNLTNLSTNFPLLDGYLIETPILIVFFSRDTILCIAFVDIMNMLLKIVERTKVTIFLMTNMPLWVIPNQCD